MSGSHLNQTHRDSREAARRDGRLRAQDIEPGRPVPNHWDDDGPYLLERWADRKARLARKRAEAQR